MWIEQVATKVDELLDMEAFEYKYFLGEQEYFLGALLLNLEEIS